MVVKRGCVVSHAVATEWGVGKVIEVNDVKATIQFNDGMIRKIISSHFIDLQPANPASYVAPVIVPAVKVRAASTAPKKPKKAKVVKELAI